MKHGDFLSEVTHTPEPAWICMHENAHSKHLRLEEPLEAWDDMC